MWARNWIALRRKGSYAFQAAKQKLVEAPVLAHYNPDYPIVLAGYASAYGVGAVISHRLPDGSECPVAYTSHTLTKSERNYTQVEKEALSLVFGVHKFHQYLYGGQFTILTDHKPLKTILGPKNNIPPLAATRMQRWPSCFLPSVRHPVSTDWITWECRWAIASTLSHRDPCCQFY